MIFPEAELLLGTCKTSFGVQCAFCMQIKGSIFSPVFLFKLPLDFHFHFMLCPYLFFKKTSFTNKVLLSLPWHKESFLVPKAGKEISWQYSTYKLVILMMQNVHVLIEIKIEVTEVNSWSPEIIVPANSGASVDPRSAASLISNTNLFTRVPLFFSFPLLVSVPSVLSSPLWSMVSGFSCIREIPIFINLVLSVFNHGPHSKRMPPKECHIEGKPKSHSSHLSKYRMFFPLLCPDHILPCITLHSAVWCSKTSFPVKRVRYRREHVSFFCDILNSFLCVENFLTLYSLGVSPLPIEGPNARS